MGISWSSKRRNETFHQNPSPQLISSSYSSHSNPLPTPPPSSSSSSSSPSSSSFSFQTPLPPSLGHPSPPPSSQPISSFPSNPSSSTPSSSNPHQSYVVPPKPPYPSPPPPPYPVQNQNHYPPPPPPPNPYYYQYSGGYNTYGNSNQYNNPYYGNSNQNNWWPQMRPPMLPPQPPPPPLPLYVDHQNAKKVRNDINVHKDTIKIEVDEKNPDCNLVSFTFDAVVDGSITIFYFAKKGSGCRYTPLYPDTYTPVTVPFLKGVGQKFCQPPGTGSDLGFFDLDELSKPSPNEDVFPLVIFAEACKIPLPLDEQPDQPLPTTSNAQITEAVLVKNSEGPFKVKVIKQILLFEGVMYELREIYGIGNSSEPDFNDDDPGKECVICMSEPKDTAVLPCRHMCLCSDCAKELRLQTNKCPICRQPIEELIEIKVNRGDP